MLAGLDMMSLYLIMDVDLKKELIIHDESGQSLFEFLIFLPLIVMLYTFMMNIGNAINASINQQKISRSYLFYRIQNDSSMPRKYDENDNVYQSWNIFSIYVIGWRERSESDVPIAPCYKLELPLDANEADKCDESYDGFSTAFIRVMTVVGICGATYQNTGGLTYHAPVSNPAEVAAGSRSCSIIQ